jgi:hypothetical protein
MNNKLYQKIIEDYINAYNKFDIETMFINMHDDIKFENVSNGEVDLTTFGITELIQVAEQAAKYFKERKQKITDIKFRNDEVEICVDYFAILAVDFPNGLKAGDTMELKGRSIFKFKDNKIIELRDIS